MTADDHQAMVDRMAAAGLLAGPAMEAAFRAVPRTAFVPHAPPREALDEHRAVTTHRGRRGQPTSSSSSPAIMALMLAALDVEQGHRVLEIGAGTGYDAAVLAELVGDPALVTSIDIDPVVADEARRHLRDGGWGGVDIRLGDGWAGAADRAPFDRVIVTAAVSDIASAWVEQLTDPGVIVVPLWLTDSIEVAAGFHRRGDRLFAPNVVPCSFMALQGDAPEIGSASNRRARWWLESHIHDDLAILATPSRDAPPLRGRIADAILLPRTNYTFVVAATDRS